MPCRIHDTVRLSCNLFQSISDIFKEMLVSRSPIKRVNPYLLFSDAFLLCSFSIYAGTFTLSNLGMFGVDRFDAILPPGTVFFIYF